MASDKRKSTGTDMNEDIDLTVDDGMTDQERAALRREIADADRRSRTRAKSL